MIGFPPLCFVVPPTDSFVSGGNLYNRHLVAALKDKGLAVEVVDWKEFEIKIESEKSTDSLFFFDSLYLEHLPLAHKTLRNSFMIVHYLNSLSLSEQSGADFFETRERPVLQNLNGFVLTSQFTSTYLSRRGFTHKAHFVVPPALCFSPTPRRKKTSKLQVLLVANLVPGKGILEFLESLATSTIDSECCTVRVVGAEIRELEYAQQCRRLLQSNARLSTFVFFEGLCDQKQLQRQYQKADLFVSASLMETYGMALQEAVAHRLPILALDRGNVSAHVQEGKNGHLFTAISDLVSKLEFYAHSREQFERLSEEVWKNDQFETHHWSDAASTFVAHLGNWWNLVPHPANSA